MSQKITAITTYEIECGQWRGISDNDSRFHNSHTAVYTRSPIKAESDRGAHLAANDLNQDLGNKGKDCQYQPSPSWVQKVIKTTREYKDNGLWLTTIEELGLPERSKCPCGKLYTPLRGETACHKIVEA